MFFVRLILHFVRLSVYRVVASSFLPSNARWKHQFHGRWFSWRHANSWGIGDQHHYLIISVSEAWRHLEDLEFQPRARESIDDRLLRSRTGIHVLHQYSQGAGTRVTHHSRRQGRSYST